MSSINFLDIETATVKALREMAKDLGVAIPRGTTKNDLQALLVSALEAQEPEMDEDGITPVDVDTEGEYETTLDAEESTLQKTVEYLPTKALRYHWINFGVYAAKAVAAAYGLKETHDSEKYTVTLSTDANTTTDEANLLDAAERLVGMWTGIHAAFVGWRKADETFRALPVMTSHRWASSERYLAEKDWLQGTVNNDLSDFPPEVNASDEDLIF